MSNTAAPPSLGRQELRRVQTDLGLSDETVVTAIQERHPSAAPGTRLSDLEYLRVAATLIERHSASTTAAIANLTPPAVRYS